MLCPFFFRGVALIVAGVITTYFSAMAIIQLDYLIENLVFCMSKRHRNKLSPAKLFNALWDNLTITSFLAHIVCSMT